MLALASASLFFLSRLQSIFVFFSYRREKKLPATANPEDLRISRHDSFFCQQTDASGKLTHRFVKRFLSLPVHHTRLGCCCCRTDTQPAVPDEEGNDTQSKRQRQRERGDRGERGNRMLSCVREREYRPHSK